MRLLANENISRTVLSLLRQHGHDVLSAKESMRSQSDEALLARARSEGRLLITHDKDFGELAFHTRLPAECGVILFRLAGPNPAIDNARILEVVESQNDWSGHFSVVTDTTIRMRPLR